MNSPLTGIRACVFDAYGTLFDFAAAARGCRYALGDRIDALTSLWRVKQLQYTWLRAIQDRHVDFWKVTGDALDFALGTLAIEKPGLRDRLTMPGLSARGRAARRPRLPSPFCRRMRGTLMLPPLSGCGSSGATGRPTR